MPERGAQGRRRDPWFSYRGEDAVARLERACRKVGYPTAIRVEQGAEFISRDLDLWAYEKGVELFPAGQGDRQCIHAFVESFKASSGRND